MKIGPDGALPRITSSAKDLRNNVPIIKVPNSVPSYKLVVVRSIVEHEKSSEKSSDAELSDDDLFVKFPSKSVEKEKIVDTKTDNLDKQNEVGSEGVMRGRNHYNRHRQYHNKNNRYYGRRNSNFNRISKQYESLSDMRGVYNYGNRDLDASTSRDFKSASSRNFNSAAGDRDFNSAASGRDFNSAAGGRDFNFVAGGRDINSAADGRDINSAAGGRDINSVAAVGRDFNSTGSRDYNNADFTSIPNQDFNSTADHHVPYNTDNYQHSVQHSSDFSILPWADFQPRLPQYPHTPFPLVPLPGNPRHSLGLLGDCPPYAPSLPIFQSNNPNNNFACDQTPDYPSMASNFSSNNHNNSFGHNQNSYSQKTTNYPPSKKKDFIRGKNYRNDSYGNYRNNNQLRNKHMNDDNKRKQNAWNRGPGRHPNERNNSSRNNKSYRK